MEQHLFFVFLRKFRLKIFRVILGITGQTNNNQRGEDMLRSFIILGVLVFTFISCHKSENVVTNVNANNISTDLLKNHWVRSDEEEIDSVRLFRPNDYKEFPVSRFRQIYNFKDSGKCAYLVLAPNDAHYFDEGTWKYDANNQTLEIIDSNNSIVNRYKIVSLTKYSLKMVRI